MPMSLSVVRQIDVYVMKFPGTVFCDLVITVSVAEIRLKRHAYVTSPDFDHAVCVMRHQGPLIDLIWDYNMGRNRLSMP